MSNQNEIIGIGVMSGTSLDGMDIAVCKFITDQEPYNFNIESAVTYKYSEEWQNKLINSPDLSAELITKLNVDFGKLIGKNINKFIQTNNLKNVDYIASHGHTVFHQPTNGFTLQIGSGAEISASTNIKTVCDFRSNDIALGGQGAPLVPIGDSLLFAKYDACVNLGGFANISQQRDSKRIAYDICPVNIAINHYANKLGLPYDNLGTIAKSGNINFALLKELNNLNYYQLIAPKSLGREWLVNDFLPIVEKFGITLQDKISTLTEHAAVQISNALTCKNVLITGGGTYNSHLIDSLKKHAPCEIIIPDTKLIDFKEALIFAFLGLLRINEKVNCLKSATGALRDNIGGCIYIP